ncbi:MAG: hypothetical protein KTR31_17060 [Myxococcales bacterium]|nr:hypothetical protein [Myxococcales bacterium]
MSATLSSRLLATVGLSIALGAAPAAFAQTFSYQAGAVLSPDAGIPFASESIGAPSVVYDTINDRFLMAFEARTPLTDADCPQGIWALGLAHSSDGVTWTIVSNPMLLPSPGDGTYYSCVAAQPTALFDDTNNGRLHVLFKAEEDETSCTTSSYTTCPYTGIGRLRVVFNAAGGVQNITVQNTPVLELDGPGGHPSMVQDGSTFAMTYQRYPNIYRTASSVLSSFGTGSLILDVNADWSSGDTSDTGGGTSWVYDEFKSPALVCDDSISFPWAMWVGSVNTNYGAVVDGGWGKAISSTGSSWALSQSPTETWTNDTDFRHWDVLRLITGDYLMWYSEKDGSGDSAIYFGGTTLSFNNSDVQTKNCP